MNSIELFAFVILPLTICSVCAVGLALSYLVTRK